MRTPEPEPDLGPSKESIENGVEPADALAAESAPVITNPDPEATVDGVGCSERQLDAYLEWAGSQPLAEPEPDPELEAG